MTRTSSEEFPRGVLRRGSTLRTEKLQRVGKADIPIFHVVFKEI